MREAVAKFLRPSRAQLAWGIALCLVALAVVICFSLAEPIARVLGKTGINVMTRLMGLILAALAIEVMTGGLIKIFPILASPAIYP